MNNCKSESCGESCIVRHDTHWLYCIFQADSRRHTLQVKETTLHLIVDGKECGFLSYCGGVDGVDIVGSGSGSSGGFVSGSECGSGGGGGGGCGGGDSDKCLLPRCCHGQILRSNRNKVSEL